MIEYASPDPDEQVRTVVRVPRTVVPLAEVDEVLVLADDAGVIVFRYEGHDYPFTGPYIPEVDDAFLRGAFIPRARNGGYMGHPVGEVYASLEAPAPCGVGVDDIRCPAFCGAPCERA